MGYSLYYGAALLTSSYYVLFCTLFVHACQLAFLVLVENPHIERTYGSGEHAVAMEANKRILYDPATGMSRTSSPSCYLFNHFNFFSYSPYSLSVFFFLFLFFFFYFQLLFLQVLVVPLVTRYDSMFSCNFHSGL